MAICFTSRSNHSTLHRICRIPVFCCLFLSACLLLGSSALAQETDEDTDKKSKPVEALLPKPIVIVNVASVERILTDIDLIFEMANRLEIAEIASASLSNVNDLEGIDQNKNLGFEMFLKTGIIPQPVFVSYLPVSKVRSFIETLEKMIPGDEEVIKRDPKREDIYIIDGRRGESVIRLQDGYAHMLFRGGETDETLDLIIARDFGNPSQTFQNLTTDYDLAVKLDFSAIPELMRTTFLGFFRTAIETQLQQRDNETAAAYEFRRLSGKQNLENIEYMLNQAQEMVLGARLDAKEKQGIIDLNIKARPNSDLARDIKNLPGKVSYFNVVTARENLPLAASVSVNLARRDRKNYLKYLNYSEEQLALKLMTEEERLQQNHSIQQFFAPVKSIIEKGDLDLFVQLVSTPSKKFALIGGIKVAPSSNLPAALLDLINRVEKQSDKKIHIYPNAETVQGMALHQLQPDVKTADDRQNRFLGGVPSLYVGADSQVIWFAMGTEIAVGALNEAMEQINTATPEERKVSRTAPFQFEFHMRPWLSLFSDAEIDQSDVMKVLDGVFDKENDLIVVTSQPTETGIRTRFQIDEGFLKLLGTSIALQFDRVQERRAKRAQEREAKQRKPERANPPRPNN